MHLLLVIVASLAVLQNGPLPGNWDPTNPEDVARRASDPAGSGSTDDPLKGPDVPAQTDTQGRRGGQAGPGGGGQMTVTVESILRTNCNQCHGTEKQKGGLQILPVTRLHEGPEKFRVIKPGDPAGSLLVQRISLPAGHDDIMPPEGKTLSAAEIKVIEDWITAGAKEADAKTPVAGMTGMAGKGSRGQSTSPRAFLRAYMALKDLTSEQRRAGIAAATKARNGLSAEDKKAMQEVQVMRRAIANGDEIPADLTKRREEIRSRVTALREAGAKAQSDLWALLSPEQQARVREVLAQGTANGQQDRRRERRKGDSPPPPKGPPTAP